jgi:DNA gyrase subunit B
LKRGKSERYLKDDNELNDHLLEIALEGAALAGGGVQPPLTGGALKQLCQEYLNVEATIKRLSRRYDVKLLKTLAHMPTLTPEMLKDAKQLAPVVRHLQERLAQQQNGAVYDVSVAVSSHTGTNEILVSRSEHGAVSLSRVDSDFVSSGEYRGMRQLGNHLEGMLQDKAAVRRGDKTQPIGTFDEAFQWLMEEARRGQTIQRYKGLGEMNPEQLWETTMDVATRRLLKVNIEDGVAADEIFTTLMGDQVEPRREFIERNALAVANLDV